MWKRKTCASVESKDYGLIFVSKPLRLLRGGSHCFPMQWHLDARGHGAFVNPADKATKLSFSFDAYSKRNTWSQTLNTKIHFHDENRIFGLFRSSIRKNIMVVLYENLQKSAFSIR